MDKKFEKYELKKSLSSMISFDFKRLFVSKFFYIIIACCLVAPILILVMTKMMEGSPMTDQNGNPILDQFGNPVLMEGFKSVWQMLGSTSTSNSGMTMDLVGMCNINMVFFAISVLVGIFIASEFRSGYVKNLFTLRSSKKEYVISKTLVCFVGGAGMIISFFVGSLIGGAITSLSFELVDISLVNVIMCLLSKLGIVLVFTSIFVLASVISKERLWMSLVAGLGIGMLLFMMIPIISPLDATMMNVVLSFVGGTLFAIGLGAISNLILKKGRLI